ncbi:hypothetical protein [Salipaludibacillus sp. CF4.18]|uniref:hypothetical protein n=1 Tax=Salipaludibacillus sp. CF4.18 TaxID=3373081 RepID=UPI003EE619A5
MEISNENILLYINMVLGSIAMVMVALGIMRYFSLVYDSQGYGLTFLGFVFLSNYVFFLEKKAGIDNKIIWIKSIITAVTFGILAYILY